MNKNHHPKDDDRTVEELINSALSESDEEAAWLAICALHWNGTREVLDRAVSLCKSDCSSERQLGADILGQLGVPERTYPNECCEQLGNMLVQNEDPEVLQSVLIAISHQAELRDLSSVTRFATHAEPDVRHAVVLALSGNEQPLAIKTLIKLTHDNNPNVRDWATFALGTLAELDTSEIRQALIARLQDSDTETRAEALVGLARRNDTIVVKSLIEELTSDYIGTLPIEAAELIGSNELQPYLVALRNWWDVDPELLERAISASQGPS